MINVVSGHLGSGSWCFKDIEGVTILANVQHFNRHGEFHIGPDQVINYEIEASASGKQPAKIKINFTHDRYCRALMTSEDLIKLDSMVASQHSAPTLKRDNQIWISVLLAFVIAFIGFQFIE